MVLVLVMLFSFLIIGGLVSYVRTLISGDTRVYDGFEVEFVVGIFIANAVMLVFEVMLLLNPALGFACAHWGWILGLGIALPVISFILLMSFLESTKFDFLIPTYVVMGLLIVFLMIFGLSTVKKAPEIVIDNAFEMKCLTNMPKHEKGLYNIEIDNDIDFEGKKLKSFGRYKSNYRINGNGHTIKNIDFDFELKDTDNALIEMGDMSRINNLTIKDCNLNLIPNCYDKDSEEGYECDYSLFGRHDIKMNNVAFENVVLRAKKTTETDKGSSESTIGIIETYGSDGIIIVREDN